MWSDTLFSIVGWYGLTHLALHKPALPKKEESKGAILWNPQCFQLVFSFCRVCSLYFWIFFFSLLRWFRCGLSQMRKRPRELPNRCYLSAYAAEGGKLPGRLPLCKQQRVRPNTHMETVTKEKVRHSHPCGAVPKSHAIGEWGVTSPASWPFVRACVTADRRSHCRWPALGCQAYFSLCQGRWRGVQGHAVLAAPSVYTRLRAVAAVACQRVCLPHMGNTPTSTLLGVATLPLVASATARVSTCRQLIVCRLPRQHRTASCWTVTLWCLSPVGVGDWGDMGLKGQSQQLVFSLRLPTHCDITKGWSPIGAGAY